MPSTSLGTFHATRLSSYSSFESRLVELCNTSSNNEQRVPTNSDCPTITDQHQPPSASNITNGYHIHASRYTYLWLTCSTKAHRTQFQLGSPSTHAKVCGFEQEVSATLVHRTHCLTMERLILINSMKRILVSHWIEPSHEAVPANFAQGSSVLRGSSEYHLA